MKIVIFGLTISSSWGNGHATLWRGLCRSLSQRGHRVLFFERDVPYYANNRDLTNPPGVDLRLYSEWKDVAASACDELADADVAMVTSYCPDALAATELLLESPAALKAFYDLDTPVTLDSLESGKSVSYIGHRGLKDFDLVLSYTGGVALDKLKSSLGARSVAPLYGSVDPESHHPVEPMQRYLSDLSYLGTYAADRQEALSRLFICPAQLSATRRFVMAGAQYPEQFPWTENIFFVRHLPPAEHPAFFCSSRLTLNVTRAAMAKMGHCPSGRLFEAAACGAAIISDSWEGLSEFFEPGREVLVANDTEDVMNALKLTDAELRRIAQSARERVLEDHTSAHRAEELEKILEQAMSSSPASQTLTV